jgi:hypothetical protein
MMIFKKPAIYRYRSTIFAVAAPIFPFPAAFSHRAGSFLLPRLHVFTLELQARSLLYG